MLANMLRDDKKDPVYTPGHIFISLATREQLEEFAKAADPKAEQERLWAKITSAISAAQSSRRS